MSVPHITSIAAAIALGLAAGAMLAEAAILVPWWRSLPADAFLAWYAANASRLFDFFAPLEIGSAALALIAAGLNRRRLHLASAGLALAVLLFFPFYFEDVNAAFEAGTIPPGDLGAELARWAAWHWTRTVIGLAAFATATLAATKVGGAFSQPR